MEEKYTHLGALIRNLRIDKGWSRERLVVEIEVQYGEVVSHSTIKRLEGGENSTYRTIIIVFGALFHVPEEEFEHFFEHVWRSGLGTALHYWELNEYW